jgi:hypothetical protein
MLSHTSYNCDDAMPDGFEMIFRLIGNELSPDEIARAEKARTHFIRR